MRKLPLLACGAACLTFTAPAQDYLGARNALDKADAIAAGYARPGRMADSKGDPRDELQAFAAEAPAMKPRAAAERWVELIEARSKPRPALSRSPVSLPGFTDYVRALPPPKAWPYLREILRDRDGDRLPTLRTLALAWFASRLNGDAAAMQSGYASLASFLADPAMNRSEYRQQYLRGLETSLFAVSDDGEALARLLEDRIARRVSGAEAGKEFLFPDLLTLLGEEKTTELLRAALTTVTGEVKVEGGAGTEKLAARVALENITGLQYAQWRLAASLEQGSLYHALLERFGEGGANFRLAQTYELMRLLLADKTGEAFEMARRMTSDNNRDALPSAAIMRMVGAGHAEPVAKFFHRLLSEFPELPYWKNYAAAAVRAGLADRMLALMARTLKQDHLPLETRRDLENDQALALLAADRLEEGVAALQDLMERGLQAGAATLKDHYAHKYETDGGIVMAQVGTLTGHDAWVKEGLKLSWKMLAKLQQSADAIDILPDYAVRLARALLDLERGPEAEKVLVQALGTLQGRFQNARPGQYNMARLSNLLRQLAGVYAAAGRPADIVTLLDEGTGWMARDLSQIYGETCFLGARRSLPLGACAAKALAQTGRTEQARRILDVLLAQGSGNDRVYELLVALDGKNALSTLDRVFAEDPFEERPLIWKAKLLLDAGKIAAAEKAARQAIRIDPSDGEQGPGDRMRVYAVLAGALEQEGKTKEAEFFRGVVKSIRLSEKADTFYAAGLRSRAIALYQESLKYFSDAYCIQSRLALRLAEAGRWQEAEEHYRKAYELMPDSFGRVESHCFGCEKAFAGERQQDLAERVFRELARAHPDQPQVHYLLGYLQMDRERYPEAAAAFEKAVQLDPDYLNAWKKLANVGEKLHLPAKLRNAIAANLLRLDPWQRRTRPVLEGVTDLASAWTTMARFDRKVPPVPPDLYPLPASTKTLLALEKTATTPGTPYASSFRRALEREPATKNSEPGQVFSEQPFTRAIEGLVW